MTKLRASSLVLGAMLCAALTSTLFAQNIAPSSAGGGDDKKPAKTDTKKTPTTDEQIAALAEQMKKMQEVIDAQQQKIDTLEKVRSFAVTGVVPRMGETEYIGTKNASSASIARRDDDLTLHIGDATITPVGFVDFTAVFRNRNTGSTFATNFGGIPYNNTIGGNISEIRLGGMTGQLGFRVNTRHANSDITGYVEMDFLGNDAANVFVNTNSHTMRLRQFWVDVRHDKTEIAGGQMWSLLTPNRHGLGPDNGDVFFTSNIDRTYQVGLPWARQAGFRFIYHPSDHWSAGFAIENPQQYIGAGEVIFPFAYNAQLGTQFDANNNAGAPNMLPDFIGKVAYDRGGNHPMHIEAGGFLRTFRTAILLVGGTSFTHMTKEGFGGELNAFIGLTKNFRYVGTFFGSTGGGRYIGGLGPDAVVGLMNTASFDANIRPVDSYSTVQGFEANATHKLMLSAYYGGAYFRHNYGLDFSNPVPGRFLGFGGPNSPNSANRAVQEFTFNTNYTMWHDPKWGAFQWLNQASYVTRAPWFVPAGAPTNANTFMLFTSFRYVFPGQAPDQR